MDSRTEQSAVSGAIRFQTPGGQREYELILDTTGSALTGSLAGTAIQNGQMDGNEISFTARLSSPFPMKIRCAASIDGDTITGMAKAAMMSIFIGTRGPA